MKKQPEVIKETQLFEMSFVTSCSKKKSCCKKFKKKGVFCKKCPKH